MSIKAEVDTKELLRMLDKVPLNKNELRRAIRPAAQAFFNAMQNAVTNQWGVRTGRMAHQGVKIGTAPKDEPNENSAAYRIYFSRKKGTRGKSDYIAPTFVARWLESGTEPHYTAKGITRRKMRRGVIVLGGQKRKLQHPGFKGRPVAQRTQDLQRRSVEDTSRQNILLILRKKGVEDA